MMPPSFPPPPLSLESKLAAALASRDERQIRRRLLPPPSPSQQPLVDFNSNDYLSLSTSPELRTRFLEKLATAPQVLGSGGSRLLLNGPAHAALERRLEDFFGAESGGVTLFNSGFDANSGFFAAVPQPGDFVLTDELVHASVHDGVRSSRAAHRSYAHNCVADLRVQLDRLVSEHAGIKDGRASVIIATESLFSMDGTFAPLPDIVRAVEECLPRGNGYVVVDEAHATGIVGPSGRGLVAHYGLERRVFARLHTFGKALAGSGAVMITTPLVKDYMLNYARSLIYTTALSFASVIAADCAFDMLMDGSAAPLSAHLHSLSAHLVSLLLPHLSYIPSAALTLPETFLSSTGEGLRSPIIPLLTEKPRSLSASLRERGYDARPISWPTVPRGAARVRVCLHAGNTREEVEGLVRGVVHWAKEEAARLRRDSVDEITTVEPTAGAGEGDGLDGALLRVEGVALAAKL